jgi:DNA uptake protein ComE-like DNA-binding protein
MANIAGQATTAQGAAGLTGFYAAPSQSAYTPGSFVRLDPGTYDTNQYGPVQISYVLPSGQLQRVSTTQAQAMGWNGNLATMNTLPAQQALMLEQAPPQQLPQQTIAGLTGYSNLNTAAQNQAIGQAGVTGYYSAPAQVLPPGTNMAGGKFSDQPPEMQRAYFQSRGSDWNAAMAGWVADSNNAISQFAQANNQPLPNQPGASQMTMQMQNQQYTQGMGMIKQAADLQANPFRQQQALGQMGRMLGGQAVAGFSAPNTVAGVGTQGGNTQGGLGYLSQMIQDIRDPTANTASMNDVLNAIPTPNKINSNDFLRSAPSTQNMVLQGMQERYGIDPKDALAQINATLPQFNAPTTVGTIRRG